LIKKIIRKWLKPNGISVLLAAQNEEKTIRLCVESFLEFGDEIIIVTNGSTDNTREICKELVKEYPNQVQFYDKPDLPDLYYNRAYALTKAKYRWIAKFDADFIAYNDEDADLSISHLRKRILNTIPFWLISFRIKLVNIYKTIRQCGIDKRERKMGDNKKKEGHYVPPIYTEMDKIFLNTPLLKFKRMGRTEHIPYTRLYLKYKTSNPSFFHLTLKSEENLFYRSERTNWREKGDFETYPTLEDYILNYVLPQKYKTTKHEAIKKYSKNHVEPYLMKYDEDRNYPYPERIKKEMDSGYFN
jgi:glycosyltransferase involved in cell wall biosynthesis